MKTGSLHAVAVLCGLALAAASSPGCASRPTGPRDEALEKSLEGSFGFTGRKLAVDLGQYDRVSLAASASRLDGGFLLLVESPNRVQALDRESLMPEWAYHALPGDLRYPPTFSPIAMLLMSGNELHQVDLRYGHSQGPPVHFDLAPSSAFAGSAGTAFVPSWGGSQGEKTLRTINLVTGLEGWGYRTPGDIRGGILIGGASPRQSIYFGTDAGDVYSFPAAEADANGPAPNWVRNTRGPVTAGLALEGEDLFAASESGFLYCMDRITGGIRWAAPHEIPLTEAPVTTRGSVYQHRSGSLWCHDRATGSVRWKLGGASRLVAEREGKSLVASHSGELWLVNPAGQVTGKMAMGGFYYPTNTSDSSVYAVSGGGDVFKLHVRRREVPPPFAARPGSPPGPETSPPVPGGGDNGGRPSSGRGVRPATPVTEVNMTAPLPVLASFLSGNELWIVLLLALLFFGASRLPGIARSLGRSVNEFKAGMKDEPETQKPAQPANDATKN